MSFGASRVGILARHVRPLLDWRGPRLLKTSPTSTLSAATSDPEAYALPTAAGATNLGASGQAALNLEESDWKTRLPSNQYLVLRKKATEPGHRLPFPAGFDDHFQPGVYFCAGCWAAGKAQPLYTSKMKFDCGCGWPGFWTNVADNVIEQRDADGLRCEILCSSCHGHLGHVFRGEGFGYCTDERHCVNSLSMVFIASSSEELVKPLYQGPVYGP
mmetsp:Transcript_101/g.207  ORF Transcript_101/g.207 Transcript_101/m.207 type:complete len:216 (-) Transcript_101:40-687(-)